MKIDNRQTSLTKENTSDFHSVSPSNGPPWNNFSFSIIVMIMNDPRKVDSIGGVCDRMKFLWKI